MLKRCTIFALCAASIQAANVSMAALPAPLPEQAVSLHAVVSAGTTSSCGMREAPHLIEHLLLSETRFGKTPVDAILTLRSKGIKLSAMTHSDFTEFTLEGPASQAELMSEALVNFLSRPSLPNTGFDSEKRVIVSEVMAGEGYTSSPTLYERFIATHGKGVKPCAADTAPFLSYRYEDVQAIYRQLYTPQSIKVLAQSAPGTFDLDAIESAIGAQKAAPSLTSQNGPREPVQTLQVNGRANVVEIIFPIAGRTSLSAEAASALADQARLEVQAHIRSKYQLYAARSFVDQSLVGGWIRIEVPGLGDDKTPELLDVAKAAMDAVDIAAYGNDLIWLGNGSVIAVEPIGSPVVSGSPDQDGGWIQSLLLNIRAFFVSLFS